jgi:Cft2 family RNA processing exonuclease
MKLTDLNTGRDIGANCLHVEIGPFRFMVDCGLHPKKAGKEGLPNLNRLADDSLDFLIVTHSHLDHGGSVPVAARFQPNTPILLSPGTKLLLPRMLRNSCSVMMRQRDELSLPEYPLFTYGEIERLEGRLQPMPFHKPRVIEKKGEKLEITFFPAGHVAGAAGVRVVYKKERIFFTGDVLFNEQLTLTGARFPEEHFDTIITETTRGAHARKVGASREKEVNRLLETLGQTLAAGGSVLVPVFALGRMQEILALLHKARREGKLPESLVFASGLGLDLADYFDQLSREHDSVRFRRRVMQDLNVQPFRQKLVPGREPGQRGLYVISSGMMVENTPSYALAASILAHPRNSICFVGYCDPDTPGGRLQLAAPEDKFTFGSLEYIAPVRAKVEKFDLSGHADREELLAYAQAREPRNIVLTHGDPPARDWFAQALASGKNPPRIIDPVPGETYEI